MHADWRDAPQAAAGALVLIVGPSGAGKDTLIAYAREHLHDDRRFVFATRSITRPSVPPDRGGEVHRAMTEAQFLLARERGEFALSWHSHGFHYGIPCAAIGSIADGLIVVANVSRAVIPSARPLAARRLVVNVTAPPDVLAARLSMRGRETKADIAARVARTVDIDPAGADVIEISNEGSVEQAGGILRRALLQLSHVTP